MTGDLIAILFGCAAVAVILGHAIRARAGRSRQKEQLMEEYTKGGDYDDRN